MPSFSYHGNRTMWNEYEIAQYKTYETQIGPLRLHLRLEGDEVLIASEYDDKRRDLKPPIPLSGKRTYKELPWMRYVIGEESNTIHFTPMMPDKPVIVRPNYPIHVLQNKQIFFFVNIPIWVRVSFGGFFPKTVEFPSARLSKSWFGDTLAGELCYELKTKALRNEEDPGHLPYMATCALKVQNSSEGILNFNRICVHVENLGVYRGPIRLWTNTVTINFREGDNVSQVNVINSSPPFEPTCEKISEPRETSTSSLVRRSFHFLKSLTGF